MSGSEIKRNCLIASIHFPVSNLCTSLHTTSYSSTGIFISFSSNRTGYSHSAARCYDPISQRDASQSSLPDIRNLEVVVDDDDDDVKLYFINRPTERQGDLKQILVPRYNH